MTRRRLCRECGKMRPNEDFAGVQHICRRCKKEAAHEEDEVRGQRSGGMNLTIDRGSGPYTRQALGWQPTCDHNSEPEPAVVLDPFCGSGTTGIVPLRHGRSFIGIELNPDYIEMARERIIGDAPLLNAPRELAEGAAMERSTAANA